MSWFRVAIDAKWFAKSTKDVNIPPNLKNLILKALNISGNFNDLLELCEEIEIECPVTKFISLEEADALSKRDRLHSIPVQRQKKVAIPFETWSPDQLEIRLLYDVSEDDSESKSVLCQIQFDKAVESFTIDRLDENEAEIVVFSEHDDVDGTTELRLSIISELASIRPKTQNKCRILSFDQIDNLARPIQIKPTCDKQRLTYALPIWFGHLMTVWLSNVLRAHTLCNVVCNSCLPSGCERNFSLDSLYITTPCQGRDCVMSLYLHQSTCSCLCTENPPPGLARPMFRISFCGTSFTGMCYRHGERCVHDSCATFRSQRQRICTSGINLMAVCKHENDTDFFKRGISLLTNTRDVFLSSACSIACELANGAGGETCHVDEMKSALLDSCKDSLMAVCKSASHYAKLKHSDMIAEDMIESKLFTKKRKKFCSESKIVRKDGASVRVHERAVLSTHSHLFENP